MNNLLQMSKMSNHETTESCVHITPPKIIKKFSAVGSTENVGPVSNRPTKFNGFNNAMQTMQLDWSFHFLDQASSFAESLQRLCILIGLNE